MHGDAQAVPMILSAFGGADLSNGRFEIAVTLKSNAIAGVIELQKFIRDDVLSVGLEQGVVLNLVIKKNLLPPKLRKFRLTPASKFCIPCFSNRLSPYIEKIEVRHSR